MIVEEFSIKSPTGLRLAATNVLNMDGDPPTALLLHGMHNSGRQLFTRLSDQLAEKGIGNLRFDQSGWGDSDGNRNIQSLADCLSNAKGVIRQFEQGRARIIIGHSMGGYIAARLLEVTKPDLVILFCPALYPASYEGLPFDLHRDGDYRDAPVLDELRNYTGRVLMITGTEDELIPEDAFKIYADACTNCTRFEWLELEGGPHGLQGWLQQPENAGIKDEVLATILNFAQPA